MFVTRPNHRRGLIVFVWRKKQTRALCVAEIELIKSTARKRGTEETHLKTIQKRNSDNGNPKRIWLQWHSNGNIGKAPPLSSAFFNFVSLFFAGPPPPE